MPSLGFRCSEHRVPRPGSRNVVDPKAAQGIYVSMIGDSTAFIRVP